MTWTGNFGRCDWCRRRYRKLRAVKPMSVNVCLNGMNCSQYRSKHYMPHTPPVKVEIF